MTDSPTYQQRRTQFDNLLTLFGRKPVLEALRSEDIRPVKLHLATSNRDSTELREMRAIAAQRNVEIVEHTRQALARISRNGRQDQGTAIDIEAPRYLPLEGLLTEPPGERQLLALDSVTNPQNLGMIIRSVAASPLHGLILPRKGSAPIDGLVIKASAGTLFKCRIYHCSQLGESLARVKRHGYRIVALDSHGSASIRDTSRDRPTIFVLGNETAGLSDDTLSLSDETCAIPLANGVESLNVSVAAALIAFYSIFWDR